MRLKYFLRGLGAGIILGALVMLCSVLMSGSYRLSDDQIRERAEKLGMVSAEEAAAKQDKTETEAISSEKASTTEKATTEKTTAEKTTEEKTTEATESTEATETTETTEATTEEKTTEATTEAATTEEKTTEATTEATTEKTTEATTEKADADSKTKVKISVTPGMDSYTVAVLLQDAGIVKDAAEFDNYLNSNGYSTRIRVNEFEFKAGMSDKEIAEKLVSEGQ